MSSEPQALAKGASRRSRHGPRYTLVRQHNQRAILDLFMTGQPLSRPQLAAGSHLSVPTVDVAVEYLMERGLVEAVGHKRGGVGRSAVLYQLRSHAAAVIAIDVGVRRWRVSVSDVSGHEFRHDLLPAPAAGHVLEALLELCEELVRDVQLAGSQNVVVSIGTPGVPDPKSGELQFVENIADLSGVPLVHVVQEELGVLAYVEKDVNLAALGEQRNGCAQGCDNFAFISVGNGVGMGAITDGQPLRGARGAAGELGLLPFPTQPSSSQVRRHGALEMTIGAEAIRRRARELLRGGQRSVLSQRPSAEDVLAAAAAGDTVGVMIVREVGAALATAIAAVAVVLDPELVVLGGGIGSQQVVIDAARAALSAMYDHPVNVMGSALGTDSALVGAQAAGRDRLVHQIMESLG